MAYIQVKNPSIGAQEELNTSESVHVSDMSSITMAPSVLRRAEYVSSSPFIEGYKPSTSGATLNRKRQYRQHIGETDSDKEAKMKDKHNLY